MVVYVFQNAFKLIGNLMSKYPYYVALVWDYGIMIKVFKSHKFKSLEETVEALQKYKKRDCYERQYFIANYTAPGTSRLLTFRDRNYA